MLFPLEEKEALKSGIRIFGEIKSRMVAYFESNVVAVSFTWDERLLDKAVSDTEPKKAAEG